MDIITQSTMESASAGSPSSIWRKKLIQGVTAMLHDILGKNPQTTLVVIEEIDTDNWGIAGETITERRIREKKGR